VATAIAEAALLALSYFYSIASGMAPGAYEDAIRAQLVAVGATQYAATAELKWWTIALPAISCQSISSDLEQSSWARGKRPKGGESDEKP
jgi:hypothetical protein